MAGGLVLSAGAILGSLMGAHTLANSPLAVVAQMIYLVSYLLLGGLALLVSRHTWGADRARLLDDALLVTASAWA